MGLFDIPKQVVDSIFGGLTGLAETSKTEQQFTTEIVNKTISELLFKSIQNCSTSVSASQIFIVEASYAHIKNVKMQQAVSMISECSKNFKLTSDIKTELADQIKQLAEVNKISLSKLIPVGGGIEQTIDTYITNEIENKIKLEDIQNCVSQSILTQAFIVSASATGAEINDIAMEQTFDGFLSCYGNSLNDVGFMNKIATNVDTTTKTEETLFGFNPLYLLLIILIIIVIIGFAIILLIKKQARVPYIPISTK